MPAMQPDHNIISLEQYEAFPEETRAEVFDGLAYDMASPSQIHQSLLLEISTLLHLYIKNKKGSCRVFPAPFDVLLSKTPLTILQPDIMIVCDKSKLDGARCNGAPDFVIEIVSPSNAADDYVRKLYYYQKYGVREYWIVDPKRRIITVNYFEGNLLNVQYPFESVIKVHIYEDLFLNFSEIADSLDI